MLSMHLASVMCGLWRLQQICIISFQVLWTAWCLNCNKICKVSLHAFVGVEHCMQMTFVRDADWSSTCVCSLQVIAYYISKYNCKVGWHTNHLSADAVRSIFILSETLCTYIMRLSSVQNLADHFLMQWIFLCSRQLFHKLQCLCRLAMVSRCLISPQYVGHLFSFHLILSAERILDLQAWTICEADIKLIAGIIALKDSLEIGLSIDQIQTLKTGSLPSLDAFAHTTLFVSCSLYLACALHTLANQGYLPSHEHE